MHTSCACGGALGQWHLRQWHWQRWWLVDRGPAGHVAWRLVAGFVFGCTQSLLFPFMLTCTETMYIYFEHACQFLQECKLCALWISTFLTLPVTAQ